MLSSEMPLMISFVDYFKPKSMRFFYFTYKPVYSICTGFWTIGSLLLVMETSLTNPWDGMGMMLNKLHSMHYLIV